MLRTIRKLLGEKSNQIKFPIALMGADAVLSIVLYVVLYMTVIQLLSNTLTAGVRGQMWNSKKIEINEEVCR